MDDHPCQYVYAGQRYGCSTSLAMDLIGGKWKSVLLHHLLGGERRFSELRRLAAPITERTLSLQLKQLEGSGLVSRHVHTARPPLKVTYRLTPLGEGAGPAVRAIAEWGGRLAEEHGAIVPREG